MMRELLGLVIVWIHHSVNTFTKYCMMACTISIVSYVYSVSWALLVDGKTTHIICVKQVQQYSVLLTVPQITSSEIEGTDIHLACVLCG